MNRRTVGQLAYAGVLAAFQALIVWFASGRDSVLRAIVTGVLWAALCTSYMRWADRRRGRAKRATESIRD
jgi:hypothetical protein